MTPALVWFRQDLRLSENPALAAAVASGSPVVPVFIWAPEEEGDWPPGAASRWWLAQSLAALDAGLRKHGSRLIIRRGPSAEALESLIAETGATAVYWNRRYEPAAIARDTAVKARLRARGIAAESCNGSLLFEPWTVQTKSGTPFRVFTPFWRTCLAKPIPPAAGPGEVRALSPADLPSLPIASLQLDPSIDWAAGLRETWEPGEAGAARQLDRFLTGALSEYPEQRDLPAAAGTSRLSPHLHFGEIGPAQVWRAVQQRMASQPAAAEALLRQLAWREFAYHLLYHNPDSPHVAMRPEFTRFPWKQNAALLRAWTKGRTGYPLVDAGMRELWHTGWMHNRVRMVAASFLVKHLLIPWQDGAGWFWDTLVDADLANNTLGWQWVAGCGADAAPYFRIFNPMTQASKFDPASEYILRWIPDTSGYPKPVVDHDEARRRALDALSSLKAQAR